MKITDEAFYAAVRAVAAERPDHIYDNPDLTANACLYVHNANTPKAKPGCIIGAALHRLGVSLDKLNVMDGYASEDGYLSSGFDFVGGRFGLSDAAVTWGAAVQGHQDNGMPWGSAVAKA